MSIAALEAPATDRRFADLRRRHAFEVRLADALTGGAGLVGLVRTAEECSGRSVWLLDRRGRSVTRSTVRHGEVVAPDLDLLLEKAGPIDVTRSEPVTVDPHPAHDLVRRHLLMPVSRDGVLFAWLVVAEIPGRFTGFDTLVAARTARYLATEYAMQHRVARVASNARSTLARQMVRGSSCDADLLASAEYLGVDVTAHRVIVFLADQDEDRLRDDAATADAVARDLSLEVLGARGSQGTILLVEAEESVSPVVMVNRIKRSVAALLRSSGERTTVAGISAVVPPDGLNRAYREAREVVVCANRFAGLESRVIAVDDLGPARLFVANSDTASVRRYVRDILGPLLGDAPGLADLLRTLQCYFDTGRSVREAAALLSVHENTVRLRLAKVHDLTGLDVAAGANDQLSVQTAMLVLRLEGHPAIPPFDVHCDHDRQETA